MGINGSRSFSPSQVKALVGAGFAALEERRDEINDLNVYPVPDGDTGTNLALTVRSILNELEQASDDLPAGDLAGLISSAALMGARGNSGVILSQIIRGAMEVFKEGSEISNALIAEAFRHATDTAYRAIRRPVEGTMLTVIREMAEAAEMSAAVGESEPLLQHVVRAAWDSVKRTPRLLKVLADAGVVDAGGFGIAVLFEGMVTAGVPAAAAIAPASVRGSGPSTAVRYQAVEATSPYTYCTSFLLSGSGLDLDGLESELLPYGDSLLVVGSDSQLKVHIHTDAPGDVLSIAVARGVLHDIEIDNMKEQTALRTERLVARDARLSPVGAGSVAESGRVENQPGGSSVVPAAQTQVVAVVTGEGNKRLFRSMGVDLLVEGGQSMNPSAEDLLRAVEQAEAPAVIVLPNNKNIILTAEQIVGLVDKEVFVVPTRCIPAGLSAMVGFSPDVGGRENFEEMEAAISGLATGQVTRAVRASAVDGFDIQEGDYMGLISDRVVAIGEDLEQVVEAVVGMLVGDDTEVLTALVGEGEEAAQAAAKLKSLKASYPEVDIEIHDGGQPLYQLLMVAE